MKTRHGDIFKINKGFGKRSMQRIFNRDKQKQVEAQKQISNVFLSPTNYC